MKTKNFIFFIFIGTILTGLLVLSFLFVNDKLSIFGPSDNNQVSAPQNQAAGSITKGSSLLLLIVGIIGFLGVSRKKKVTGDVAQNHRADAALDNQSLNSNEQKIIHKNV